MSLQACADLLARGDPDRFAAAMAAPVPARRALLPIYAFNLEVARAPWATHEPMIAEMRLQWWRDALAEIGAGEPPRRHEVVTPLAEVLDADGAAILDALVAARRVDVEAAPFADLAALEGYLDATGGGLMWAAARALGGTEELAFRAIGGASALANLCLALPELAARGKRPLPDTAAETLADLAAKALANLRATPLPREGRAAVLAAWRAKSLLSRAARDPSRVFAGRLETSEFRRRLTLFAASLRV